MKDCTIYSGAKIVEIRDRMLGFNGLCAPPSVEGAVETKRVMPSDKALKCAGVFCGCTGHCK